MSELGVLDQIGIGQSSEVGNRRLFAKILLSWIDL